MKKIYLGFVVTAAVFSGVGYYLGNKTSIEPGVKEASQEYIPAISESEKEYNSGDERQLSFVKNIYKKEDDIYIDADYLQWLSEDQGTCFVERENIKSPQGLPDCSPNGFLIVNDNPKIRTFKLSPEVKIRLLKDGGSIPDDKTISPEEFMNGRTNFGQRFNVYSYEGMKDSYIPFRFILKDGSIQTIHQVYVP